MSGEGMTGGNRFGKYTVVRKIASGGMAEVYLCRFDSDHGFSKKVAIKAIRADRSSDPRFRELFVREARLSSTLSHPNIVSIFDFGQEADRFYLVMEFVDGCPLSRVIARMREEHLPIPLPVWRHWMEGLLAGLGYLHSRGIVHRDVSPSNILVTKGGGIKLTDFGISRKNRIPDGAKATIDGKPGYLAPEVLEGVGDDSRSDLFSAALSGVEILVHEPVFQSRTIEEAHRILSEFDPDRLTIPTNRIDSSMNRILRKALARKPEDRFQDADSFAAAFEGVLPARASRRESEYYWESLFREPVEEETRIDLDSADIRSRMEGAPILVRERVSPYGSAVRNITIAIATASLVGVGGGYLYQREAKIGVAGMAERQNEPIPPSPIGPPPGQDPGRLRKADLPGTGSGLAQGKTGLDTKPESRPETPDIGEFETPGRLERNPVPEKELPAPVVATGTVPVIHVTPWAKVYEGDRFLGETPVRGAEFTVGEHRLRLVNEPLGADRTIVIHVKESGNQKVIVRLIGSGGTD